VARPGWLKYLGEWRAGGEFLEGLRTVPADNLPSGNGRILILIPGLWGGDNSLMVLRRNLAHIGYDARTWGLGLNNRCGQVLADEFTDKLKKTYERRGKPIALIGHSRGGFVAREAARRLPNIVDQVITMGTPIAGQSMGDAGLMVRGLLMVSRRLYATRPGCMSQGCGCDYVSNIGAPLPSAVRVCSLWSAEDGVVAPEKCVLPDEPAIEVKATHVGMIAKPEVFAIVARLLAGEL